MTFFKPRFWKKLSDDQKIKILSYLYPGEFLEVKPESIQWVLENLVMKFTGEKVTRQTIYNFKNWLEKTEEGRIEYERLKKFLEKRGKLKLEVEDILGSIILLPLDVKSKDGFTNDINVREFTMIEVCINVTHVNGINPVLNIYIEGKDRYTGKYKVLAYKESITTIGTYWLTINNLAFTYIHARWTISGVSPSFKFSISLEGK